jgi:hypothetical protein
MTTFTARIMDADSGNEGRYDFEGPEDLLTKTPVRVVRHFMEYVDKSLLPAQHVDYELNAAMKNQTKTVVTALGEFHFEHGGTSPFLMMISRKRG